MTWLFRGAEEKNFFETKEYQYCFITSLKGDILHSKYKNEEEDKKFETEIEKQIKKSLSNKNLKVIRKKKKN